MGENRLRSLATGAILLCSVFHVPAAEAAVLLLPGNLCIENAEFQRNHRGVVIFERDKVYYLIGARYILSMVEVKPENYQSVDPEHFPEYVKRADLTEADLAQPGPFNLDISRRVKLYLRGEDTLTGYLVSWNDDEVIVKIDDGEESIPTQQVVEVVYASPETPTGWVRRDRAYRKKALQPGNVVVLFQGSIYQYPTGALFDLENRLNPIRGWVMYRDGTVKWSELKHASYMYSGSGEYICTDDLGVVAGLNFYTLAQIIAAGGGNYEEKKFAEGNLLTLVNPFVGLNYYFVNDREVYIYVGGRIGADFGTLYPMITTFNALGEPPVSFGLSGMNLAAGIGAGGDLGMFVMRLSLFYNHQLLSTSEKVYMDLDKGFGLGMIELNGGIGVKF